MKMRKRFPETDKQKHAELIRNGWALLKEPKSPLRALVLSVPFMIINLIVTVGIVSMFSAEPLRNYMPESILITIDLKSILGVVSLLLVHELLHLILIPNFIASKSTYVGITLFGGYVYTEEQVSKTRYIVITLLPFVVISIILPALLGLLGALSPFMLFLIVLNSLSSSLDILNWMLIWIQVPSQAVIVCNGSKTYWKSTARQKSSYI
ncbi:DUF3267 domain-containing protein [Paenibacillus ehimensis]|uniref:DUF3267 domain-containing protein n=1 Tax=Paenibacillus ehimensis TaxID=79264 RepID=A0ABT8VHA9_9BACL|nr:DUF3267 domain-containing protein [Paenibacillus ehimensis]MDO3680348.1 DUF3267 domain-containing protein [Paenibacillus ehimensis]MEC0211410.1 DUF3267 domain-containing protein [Paenibacillus ehimensis]